MSSIIGSEAKRDFNSNLNKIPNIEKSSFIANNSKIIGNVEIGEDSSVWFNCLLRGDGNLSLIHISEPTRPY